jgi:hypothetical protein
MNASKLKLGFGALVVAGAAMAFVVQHQAQVKSHAENESLRQQVAHLQTDNGGLSNRLAAAGNSRRPSEGQLNELLKLRGEVAVLQQQVGEIGKLREEVQRLQATQRSTQSPPASMDAQEQAALLSLNRAKQGLLAFIMFADANQQQFPTSFAQAAPFLKEGLEPVEMNFEIVYVGSITNITNAAATIVLREKHAWQSRDGKWRKTYGFADGHAEIHMEPSGNFDDWESQRIIPPPNQ